MAQDDITCYLAGEGVGLRVYILRTLCVGGHDN